MTDWSHDHVLNALQGLPDPVGSLVVAFPGRSSASDDSWLENWFIKLTRNFARGRAAIVGPVEASSVGDTDISLLSRPPVEKSVRVVAIRPVYFRGFRGSQLSVNLDSDLVVFEGRNSSGKTSLSEAIEWTLTGHLSRRDSGQHGAPSELANCIANEFRPDDAETFVELVLDVGGTPQVIRRVLERDYSQVAANLPVSKVYLDGKALSGAEEQVLLNGLFAGVHPILMQHNLRRFVHDEPHARRQYFERLLQVDELTALIEKAVIGPTRIKQIGNPAGGTGLAALRNLITELQNTRDGGDLAGALSKLERVNPTELPTQLEKGLLKVASEQFSVELEGAPSVNQVREHLAEVQRLDREARLPLLADLNSARAHEIASWDAIDAVVTALAKQQTEFHEVSSAAAILSNAQRDIATVAGFLAEKGLVDLSPEIDQRCALCEDPGLTLRVTRVADLATWHPLSASLAEARSRVGNLRERAVDQVRALQKSLETAVPKLPSRGDVSRQLKRGNSRISSLAGDAVSSAELVNSAADLVFTAIVSCEATLVNESSSENDIERSKIDLFRALQRLTALLAEHRELVATLEEAVGSLSRDDSKYRLRDKWLELAGLTSALAEDTSWEIAKQKAKTELDAIRDGLIALRTRLIEHAREKFSDDMTTMWHLLRSDSGAQFSRIYVPEARGKGYKLLFELKALISDGTETPEVDALRVFSESQVNVVGLAAYVTRARSLGHRVLIFDDPVQSMDEEHFRSFAASLLPALLDEGLQVLILTHSDTFARGINDAHYMRDSYATLHCRSGKRHGCQVEEGNRRVSERLKKAEMKASDGELHEAWRFVRLALERLYTLTYLRNTPEFQPDSWWKMSAEDMWNHGAGQIIETTVSGSGTNLKAILDLTAAGAHDKAAPSETDIHNAINYIKTLLTPLRLGAG